MSRAIEKAACFLCGSDAKSGDYNGGIGKAFIECINKSCGEYLITNIAMNHLGREGQNRREFSKKATSKEEIQDRNEILLISYDGGIQANFKPPKDVLSQADIDFFGFRKRDD